MTREYFENISLRSLIDEVIDMASGDDWDGCFTKEGGLRYELALEILTKRLTEEGIHYYEGEDGDI